MEESTTMSVSIGSTKEESIFYFSQFRWHNEAEHVLLGTNADSVEVPRVCRLSSFVRKRGDLDSEKMYSSQRNGFAFLY